MRHTFWQTFKVCQSFFTHTSPKSQKSQKSYPSHQFRIQNSKFRIQNTPHLSQVPKVLPVPLIQNSKFKIQNTPHLPQVPKVLPVPPIQNSKFKIQNSKFKIILYLCPLKGNTTFFEDEYHNKNKIQLS